MAQPRRKNEKPLVVLRACGIALVTVVGLAGMSARPEWLPIAVGIVVGAVALASTELAVMVTVVALSVPLIAVQPVVGSAMLIVLIASVRYLGADGGRGFLILGLTLAGAFLGPVWAGVALAGYLLGAGEGALVAAPACLVVEASGVALGRSMLGATITGGPAHTIVSFTRMPDSLLSPAWIAKSLAALDSQAVTSALTGFSRISQPLVLFLQPWLWALGAIAAGMIAGPRETWVRIGLASGEVVLDKNGRPFIGSGLNLAARVMNLADGGQIFATEDVAEAALGTDVQTSFFGEFELKNISRPVEIAEILWDPDQLPRDPRDTGMAL